MTRRPVARFRRAMGTRPAGFTLFELIFALTVLLVLAALVLPRLTVQQAERRLDLAFDELRTRLQRARLQAIDEGAIVIVRCEGTSATSSAEGAAHAESRTWQLPAGIQFGHSGTAYVRFRPDGAASSGLLELIDDAGRRLPFRIDRATGTVRREPPHA